MKIEHEVAKDMQRAVDDLSSVCVKENLEGECCGKQDIVRFETGHVFQ